MSEQATSTTNDPRQNSYALVLGLGGVATTAVVIVILFWGGMRDAKDMVGVAGVFTSVTGTLVGTFLGAHAGAMGKATLQRDRDDAVTMSAHAMAMLSPEDQQKVEHMAAAARRVAAGQGSRKGRRPATAPTTRTARQADLP